MPALSDIKTESNLKILLFGNSGAGKTCFAAGFPGPILYLDFDGKVDSAAEFYKADKERLSKIDVRQLQQQLMMNPTMNPIAELNKIIATELIPAQKSGALPFKTLVLDSITTFSSLTLNHILLTNPGIKRNTTAQGNQPGLQDYGILKREFAKLIPGLLSLQCNVVMLGHISTDKDEQTGEIIRGPLMDGSFAKELPIYFKEVWRAFTDDKGVHYAQTKSDSRYNCRSQLPKLPSPMPLSYAELSKYL